MTRTHHSHERGSSLGWKRWRRRNMWSRPENVAARDLRSPTVEPEVELEVQGSGPMRKPGIPGLTEWRSWDWTQDWWHYEHGPDADMWYEDYREGGCSCCYEPDDYDDDVARAHHADSEAVRLLANSLESLDEATCALMDEVS